MNSKPMHKITIDHNWLEVDRVDFGTTSEVTIMRCSDCGIENQTLHMKASDKTRENPDSREEQIASLKRTNIQLNQLGETIDLQFRESLNSTRYATKENLMYLFAKRHNGDINAEHTPYGWLKSWATINHRKAQRKVLLAYKQGFVCNRCDLIFAFDELTEDHIEGDRSRAQLTDLQLLCKKCNEEKSDDPPGELDVSPFKFEGKPCIHRVTCTELDAV